MFKRLKNHIATFFNRTLKYLVGVILIALFLFLVSFSEKNYSQTVCKGIRVEVSPKGENLFLSEDEIINDLKKTYKNSIIYNKLNNINLRELEAYIKLNQFVRNAEVYSDLRGIVYIDIQQKTPVLRIISENGNSYYLDEKCRRMPVSNKRSANVLVASGFIDGSNPLLKVEDQIFEIANFISSDEFLKALIGQIYVKKDTEILLVPKIGDLVIEFGNDSYMDQKFNYLKIFYKNILPYEGWNKFSKVNLEFKNQIVLNTR